MPANGCWPSLETVNVLARARSSVAVDAVRRDESPDRDASGHCSCLLRTHTTSVSRLRKQPQLRAQGHWMTIRADESCDEAELEESIPEVRESLTAVNLVPWPAALITGRLLAGPDP